MIWFIIVPVLVAAAFAAAFYTDCNHGVDAAVGSFFGVIAGGVLALAVNGCAYPFTGTAYSTHTYQLSTLQDSPSTTGQFFLGIGEVSGNLSASFYVDSGDGYAAPQSVNDSDDDIRVFQDSAKPYVIERFPHSAHFWVGSVFNGGGTAPIFEFHVPKGTIKQDYSLDAK